MADGEWGLEARQTIRGYESQEIPGLYVNGEVVDLVIDDPEREM
jgi:hypothetical protein